jgi:hypothetical protein
MKYRRRGRVFHYDDSRHRSLRGSLGTSNKEAAELLANKLEVAAAAGPTSPIWRELSRKLPKKTFDKIARFYGVESLILDHTWDELASEFKKNAEYRVEAGKLNPRTKEHYDRVIRRFTEFLKRKGISLLRDITELVIEDFE